MIRNLKGLFIAALALVALGAFGASGAHAAEEKFHCSVEECRLTPKLDGTAKNSHHVFIVENEAKSESVSFTCNEIKGHARATGFTATQVTLTAIAYETCSVNGSPGVTVDMNNCDYLFTGSGGVHVECPEGKPIQVTVPGGCTFSIAAQPLTGITYTSLGTSPEREVTISTNVQSISTTASAGCSSLINPNQKLIGKYTTGNTIVTGETEAGVRADAWWA